MSFIQPILIDNFSVKFRVKIGKNQCIFVDFNNHIMFFHSIYYFKRYVIYFNYHENVTDISLISVTVSDMSL